MTLHIRDKIGIFLATNPLSKRLFGYNRSIILNRAICRKIIEYYNGDSGHQTNGQTGNLGYGLIHYSFILNIKPKRVLCIGSRKGFIPALCSLACQENGFGHVDFVDAGYGYENPNHWSGIAWWKRVDPMKHFSFLDVNKALTAYIMTTKEFAKKHCYQYDYIYIDGDHSYQGVKTDYDLFWPRLSDAGFMSFHDVTVKQTKYLKGFGVWKLWGELKGNKFVFPRNESGLGIIQKQYQISNIKDQR